MAISKSTKELLIVAFIMIILGASTFYYALQADKYKAQSQRWEQNYLNKNDSVVKRLSLYNDTITELKKYVFSLKDIKNKNSKEIQTIRQALKEYKIKYQDLYKMYQIQVYSYANNLPPVRIDTFYLGSESPFYPYDSSYTQYSFNDSLFVDTFKLFENGKCLLDYTIEPKIRGVIHRTRECPINSNIGSFACNKTFLKVFWKKDKIKTEFDCLQKNCSIKDGFEVEIVK
jgi:hypothetical protein